MAGTTKPKLIKTILAFDFGTKSIGVAVGQTITLTATPLEPIKAQDGIPNREQLSAVIKQWQPDGFVVGIPVDMDGNTMEITQRAIKFANRLEATFKKRWYPADERLSTKEAKNIAIKQGRAPNQSYAKSPVDSIAAQIILEGWLSDSSNLELLAKP